MSTLNQATRSKLIATPFVASRTLENIMCREALILFLAAAANV
jgi:hypothetical protein